AKIKYNKFQAGQRCKACGEKKRVEKRKCNIDEVRSFFASKKCVLVSDVYINMDEILEYICSCGNKAKITFGNFKSGHRCKSCGIRRGELNHKWNPNRDAVKREEQFRKR